MATVPFISSWGWSEMEELLQCPVCLELPFGPVPVCPQGHHICSPCRTRVQECPLCKAPYSHEGGRNYVVEQLLANISTIKSLMTLSNVLIKSPAPKPLQIAPKITVNQPQTVSVPPAQSRGEFQCQMCTKSCLLPVCRMLVHLRYYHKQLLKELDSENHRANFQIELICNNLHKSHIEAFKIARLGVFFFNMEYEDGNYHLFLRMVASETDADLYSYCIQIPNETYIYSSKVLSSRQPVKQVIRRKACLTLTPDAVKNITRNKRLKSVTAYVSVVRNVDNVPAQRIPSADSMVTI